MLRNFVCYFMEAILYYVFVLFTVALSDILLRRLITVLRVHSFMAEWRTEGLSGPRRRIDRYFCALGGKISNFQVPPVWNCDNFNFKPPIRLSKITCTNGRKKLPRKCSVNLYNPRTVCMFNVQLFLSATKNKQGEKSLKIRYIFCVCTYTKVLFGPFCGNHLSGLFCSGK